MTNELIKHFEGFRSEPYLDSGGIATIGYGTIRYTDGKAVSMSDASISEEHAAYMLDAHVKKDVNPTMGLIMVPLNINQKESIKSMIYNIGSSAFHKSTFLKKLNNDDFKGAAAEFMSWIYVRKKINKGLVIRRTQELILFMSPAYKSDAGRKEIVAKDNILVVLLRWLIGLFKNQRS